MSERLVELRQYLGELTFARVRNVVAKDENLVSFVNARGVTSWGDEPDFKERRREISPRTWYETDKSYTFYYGFAESTKGGDVHFDSKGHSYQNDDFCKLGVCTKQQALNPPRRGTMIVGQVVNGDKGPHFCKWARCTESERLFAEFVLSRRVRFSSEDLRRLYVSRHIREGEHTNHLINMATLLLARDLNHYLEHRIRHGGDNTDDQVYYVCVEMGFDPDLWKEYELKAREQNLDRVLKYSRLIPEPKPQPITERRAVEGDSAPVDLNTPFANLTSRDNEFASGSYESGWPDNNYPRGRE